MPTTETYQSSILDTDNRSLTWYLICRTAVITFLLGGAAVFYLKGSPQRTIIPPLFVLIGISYAEALVSVFFLKKIKKKGTFTQLQIIWDLLFVSALIVLTGGVESVFSFAYLLVIVSASFLLSRRLTILAAASAVVLFGGILDLQFFDYLQPLGLFRSASDGTFFSTIFVHAVAFFLTAVLSGTLAERWRRSEEQLQRKSIDYAELEKMNQTILEHINSGLMLINAAGRIRSFNRAASDITGLSLSEVYDRPLYEIFNGFSLETPVGLKSMNRAEGSIVKQNGETMILGYATTQAKDNQGTELGTLVTFQDLTQLKKIEEELKRADRLAAVGRLAAGMAHEIRNPLTSISGSVQLLLENTPARSEDQRLMSIVVSEADRLNGLLTDFLEFARPKLPEKSLVNVSELLDELTLLLASDQRFEKIDIIKKYPDNISVFLDPDQVQQVLWDLAVNATEAMAGQGEIVLNVTKESDQATLVIEDNGPGFDDEIRSRIFEPFFSTKEKGTGLGLAAVHSVMEAHGGGVSAERGTFGGAKFRLHFP